jgi:hypothetical protein
LVLGSWFLVLGLGVGGIGFQPVMRCLEALEAYPTSATPLRARVVRRALVSMFFR